MLLVNNDFSISKYIKTCQKTAFEVLLKDLKKFNKVPGNRKGMKLNQCATLTVNGPVIEYLEKYRVLKDIRFGALGRFII